MRSIGTKSHDRDRGRGDEPIFGAGIDELAADLRTAMRLGIVPPLDADYMAAAMVGAALEVGVAMIKREPLDAEGATSFATKVFLGGISASATLCDDSPPVAPPWRYGRSMSEVGKKDPEVGKKDPIALAVKIAGAVTVVAGAAAAVIALLPEDKPPPPPPQTISGEILNISTEPDVTLAEYQDVAPVRPKRCEGFEPPPPGALRIALAPRGNGGGPPIAAAMVGGGALRIAQAQVEPQRDDAVSEEPVKAQEEILGTTPTTTKTTTTPTTTTTTTTPTTTTPTTTTTTTVPTKPDDTKGGVSQVPASALAQLAGPIALDADATAQVLATTRTRDSVATADAIQKLKAARDGGGITPKGQVADVADNLVGEIVRFKVRITGLPGRCSYVRWSLYDAKARRRFKEVQFVNRDALYFRPEAIEDTQVGKAWVPLPRRKAQFYVVLELYKDEGGGLDSAKSPHFG